jgi:uncharacterized membrane protein
MATVSQSLPRQSRNWGRTSLWAFIVLMMVYVLFHNESFLVNRADPVWAHYQPFKWWLLPHGIAGAFALFLGPLQFSDRLRQRYLKVHRVIGWIYVTGALLVGPIGTYIQFFNERTNSPRSFTMAAASDAGLLMLTTAIALFFVLRGNIQQHRQWMTRSYAVALIFLEVRVIQGVLRLDDNNTAGEIIVWMCVIFAVPLADIVLNWKEFRRGKTTKAKAAAQAA